ncbi:hypothetical protein [Azospirillum halopraeferens]|uniref:hypothetical protein n=1 Tax=Azospirillum halopraeferens TaxID=34010 RepID=UPI00040B1D86|nr:hypothetical protein [Azospirillum halopraeferens]
MTDLRKDLLRKMAEIRSSLDPKLLNRARLAAFGKVPFDRDTAREAVARFLDTRDDDGAFRRKLETALRAEGASPALVPEEGSGTPPAPAPTDTTHPLKPRRIGRIT